ncbi:type IV secretion protein IcmX [Legionella sp. W05-934-2]|uniref:type IV secretion protein IcmX n=1 Tax=Legionella sp. W05-934-2 TaxID=1198649 RepID=UPI00346215EE
MIKRFLPMTSLVAVLTLSTPIYSQNFSSGDSNPWEGGFQNLGQLVLNLGGYLGYNLNSPPTNVNSSLIENISISTLFYGNSVVWFLGSLPVNSTMGQFTPSAVQGISSYNEFFNAVFNNASYSQDQSNQGRVSVNASIDQQNYQKDPISQEILNLLGTPNDSFCINNDQTVNSKCQPMSQGLVVTQALGTLPTDTTAFFNFSTLQAQLPQLNFNSLTGPLVYQSQAQNQNTTSSPTPSSGKNPGLLALSQAQAAQNFIRNVSGTILRPTLPTSDSYYKLIQTATSSKSTQSEQLTANKTLSTYFAQLHYYTAQMSLGISNLYFSLAKRMPQTATGLPQNPSSQALSEFQMATNRLALNPSNLQDNNTQWLQQINTASQASVQKEIAILLAEINYQLYLNRQIQERILLTNSAILLGIANQNKPDGSALGQNDSSSSS